MPAAVPHLPLYLTYLCTSPTLWLLTVSCQGYLSSYTGVAITACFIIPLSAMIIASCTPLVVPRIEVPTSKVVPDVDLYDSYVKATVMLQLK